MAVDLNQTVNLGNLKQTVENMKVYIDSDKTVSIKGYLKKDNKHNFYNTSTPTEDTVPVFSFDVAADATDHFLDQAKTTFVQEFAWSDTAYEGSTDPNLEGKPVFVLAVKGEDSIAYSFIDLETLIDNYTVANTPSISLGITDNEISGNVNISAEEGNVIEVKDDGLYVPSGEDNVIEVVKVNGVELEVDDVDKSVDITVPTLTSELTNDSDFVSDVDYVHTDNNFTTEEKEKLASLENYDDTILSDRVTANEEAIAILTGDGDGSISKIVDDAINEFATNNPDPDPTPSLEYEKGYRDEVIIPDKYNTGCKGELTPWREYFGYDETQTSLYISSAIQNTYGTVYENVKFDDIVITLNKAGLQSMTFKNCLFSVEAPYAVNTGTNLDTENVHVTFENCEFCNQSSACVQPTKNFKLINCKIHHMGSDGGKVFDNGSYENCYIYDIGYKEGSHADGIQVTTENSNFSIINCRFDLPRFDVCYPNAGIFFVLEGDSYNSVVKDCVMTGGNYSFYYGRKAPDAETPVVIENNVVENITVGCGYHYGLINDNSNSFDYSEVKETDKLFVSSVYKENDKIKLLVTNYTNTEKTLVCVTDKGETEITVPACPTYDEGAVYTDFSQFPFDVEVEVDGGYVVCYDTEVSEENQIRFEVFDVQPESGGNNATGGQGADGKSAYEIWLEQGNVGSEQDFLDSLKGNDGLSPTITPNPDNTDDVYKLDITTKDGTFTTPNLRGGDEVTKYTYIGTGYLSGETYYSYEDLSTKIGETVEVTVSNRYGERQDTLTIISKISDTELEANNGAGEITIVLTNTETTTAELINDNITATTSTWSSTRIKNELGQVFDNLTPEQIESLKGEDGFSPIITENEDNTSDVYKLDIETKDGKFTTPNLKGKGGEGSKSYAYSVKVIGTVGSTYYSTTISYDEIKEVYETGNPITGLYGGWTLDKVESDDYSMEAFSKLAICLDKQITATPDYISVYDLFSIQHSPGASVEAGSEYTVTYEWNDSVIDDDTTDRDRTWSSVKVRNELMALEANMQQLFIVTGEYSVDDDDNWIVSNVDKTFTEIDEALINNKDVVLRIYPEGDTTNPYILYPTMHYANMGTAFSLMVSDTGQISGLSVMITADNQVMATRNEYDFDKLNESAEIIHTDLSGNLAGITTVLDLVNALLEEYRTERKNVRFECGSISNSTLTDLPQDYGYLTIKAGGTNILEVTFAYSNLGFKKMYYGYLNRASSETLYSELNWEEVNTGVKAEIPIIENGKDVIYHKVTKNRSITELEAYTDPNGGTGYKIDDLYLTYDCEKLAKGIDDWLAEKGITPVKGETYEDVAQIQVYSPSMGGYVYLSTHVKFDSIAYLAYSIKYNDTDYIIISVRYDYDNGKTPTTFYGLNVLNIAKIIPELAGCYIQSDILDVLHNWFELYKPIGLEDTVGLYSKEEALLNQDLTVNTSIDSKTVGAFDLGNIVSLMTSPLQKLLFSVDSEGNNLRAYANDEKERKTPLSSGFFGSNLLAPKNTFATLNDMSTLPTPPDGALGIWTVVPDAAGQPETANKGGTLIIAHITSMLYSQTVSYIGTRIAIYVTQGAIYYALGYGGKYYPTASWTPASGGAFRWYKISSTLV